MPAVSDACSVGARRIITPAPFAPVSLPPAGVEARGEALPWRAVTVMLLLAGAAVALLSSLPRWAPPVAPAASTLATAPAVEHDAPASPLTADEQRNAAARRTAQVLLRASLARVEQLSAIQAERWDRGGMHRLMEALREGEKAYSEQRFRAAQDAYRAALVRAAAIEARLPTVIATLLRDADAALEQGNSAAADAAFGEVLALAPEHRAATLGRARAATLDRVRALVEQAEAYEQMGDEGKAREVYTDAARLDARMASVKAGLARLDASSRARQLRAALSDGHRALERADYNAARSAFKRAATLGGDGSEAATAMRETERRATAAGIASALERAERARKAEAWADAVRAYGAALALDAELEDAAQGQRAAADRQQLDAQLETLVRDVLALAGGPLRSSAERALRRAQGIAQPGPRLRGQVAALGRALRIAREPVAVTLLSDGQSEVTLSGAGALGRFKEHRVNLAPGHHAAVLRDSDAAEVRVEFDIAPGANAPRITLVNPP
jgi:tetratricopeptide (TPR) repeat protein